MRKYDAISIFQDGSRGGSILLPLSFCWRHCLQKINIYQQTKCRRYIGIQGWNLTIPFSKKNKLLPYWNSISGFDFDNTTAIGMLFCIRIPNFIQIGPHTAEMWRHIDFSWWRPRLLNTTSGFLFVDDTAFRTSKSISKPNFVCISQFTAEFDL